LSSADEVVYTGHQFVKVGVNCYFGEASFVLGGNDCRLWVQTSQDSVQSSSEAAATTDATTTTTEHAFVLPHRRLRLSQRR
jgi:hypothetical protein